MIKRIYSIEKLPANGIEAQKIRALWLAYGGEYEFCRFYSSESAVLCLFDGNIILHCDELCDYEEIAEFCAFSGANEVFCSENAGRNLAEQLGYNAEYLNVMKFNGNPVFCDTDHSPTLGEVYEIVSKAFGLPPDCFEQWYLDMSHRIRHNVSEVRRLDSSVLIIQHNINGEVLLSQVATFPEEQGKGNASRLIFAVCGEFLGKTIELICSDELISFYDKIGFVLKERKCSLTKNV